MAKNPLLMAQFNRGKRPPEEKKQGITPVEIEAEGHNFPYRGFETHGVAPTSPEIEYDDDTPEGRGFVVYEPEPEKAPPIDVRVVNESGREYPTWRTARHLVKGPAATQLIGRDRNRTSIKVKNMSADKSVYIAANADDLPMFGYLLTGGSELSLNKGGQDTIYALAVDPADAGAANVSLLWETAIAE